MTGDIFWDSCVFTSLLCKKEEADHHHKRGRYAAAKHLYDLGVQGKLRIFYSNLCFGECTRCDDVPGTGNDVSEYIVNWFRKHEFMVEMQITGRIMILSNKIRMKHPKIEVADSIHVASALDRKIPIMHTFDGDAQNNKKKEKKLITYHGIFPISENQMLSISPPPAAPAQQINLLDLLEEEKVNEGD